MRDRVSTKPNRYAVYDDNHNFIRYEYHERADEPTQVGDALNKANLLPDAVATALGLTGNPQVKDALEGINDNFTDPRKYWWGKYNVIAKYVETLGTSTVQELGSDFSGATSMIITVYTGIIINSMTGGFTPTGSSSKSISNGASVDGLYAYNSSGSSLYKLSGTVSADIGYGMSFFKASGQVVSTIQSPTEKVRGTFIDNAWDYLEDTYPADGEQGDYWYTYIGKNPVVAPKIEVFSYVGTGLFGVDNPVELMFDSAPKFISMLGHFSTPTNFSHFVGNGSNYQPHVLCNLLTTEYSQAVKFGAGGSISIKKSPDGKTISWYSSSAPLQMNEAGKPYYGIAFC